MAVQLRGSFFFLLFLLFFGTRRRPRGRRCGLGCRTAGLERAGFDGEEGEARFGQGVGVGDEGSRGGFDRGG